MEEKFTSQEGVPKKSLEERIKNLEQWAWIAEKLIESTLLVCEGIKNGKLGSEEFKRYEEERSILMNPLVREVQDIQIKKEKREKEKREKNNSK